LGYGPLEPKKNIAACAAGMVSEVAVEADVGDARAS
jgi:hypothetical protein